MTLPRKGLRRIVVGGVAYAWTIRKKATRVQADYEGGRLSIVIERSDNPSMKLVVGSAITHPKNAFSSESIAVRPSDVRRWIERGIRTGWSESKSRVQFLDEEKA